MCSWGLVSMTLFYALMIIIFRISFSLYCYLFTSDNVDHHHHLPHDYSRYRRITSNLAITTHDHRCRVQLKGKVQDVAGLLKKKLSRRNAEEETHMFLELQQMMIARQLINMY